MELEKQVFSHPIPKHRSLPSELRPNDARNIPCILQVMLVMLVVSGKSKLKHSSGWSVSISLEILGDRWPLLAVRDLVMPRVPDKTKIARRKVWVWDRRYYRSLIMRWRG